MIRAAASLTDAIRDHYDRVSVFYRSLWGEHIHHGYWLAGDTPRRAQARLIEQLVERAGIRPGSRVLDVGCGVGGSSVWLAERMGCEVLGLTISPVQVRMASESARRRGLDGRVRFELRDANALDLEPGGFDAVWVVECSEHLDDKADFLARCASVLRPGGVLALAAWLDASGGEPGPAGRVADVRQGMLCPSLVSMADYVDGLHDAGFTAIGAEDVTDRVRPTWAHCARLARSPVVRALLSAADDQSRAFVRAFDAIDRAYAEGAMAYGLFTARKPSPGE